MSALGRRESVERALTVHMVAGRRPRCVEKAHVLCERCKACACVPEEELDRTEYPSGRFRVTRDKAGRSLCIECRYQSDRMGNF